MDESHISLFANFDSANLARYERVWKSSSQNSPNSSNNVQTQSPSSNKLMGEGENPSDRVAAIMIKFDVEFNVWTKPDCEDSLVGPNPNRTWFYFGVKGGHGRYIKFNLMNLNKQGRLFEMGMLPVFKTVPGHEKWSRIYTRPTWQNLETNFMMSFIHRIPDKRDSVTYFAFCFPHSYEECQQMLEKYDQKFEYCKHLVPEKIDPDEIYYHRELLCHSLDQRRIDLITISGCNLMNLKREPRFDPDYLFPRNLNSDDTASPEAVPTNHTETRCYSFEKKKVFVLTSRVHPGETPASFVFNGFFEFILKKDDPRARNLRRQFVFKLVPMLNPDGVARGYYRTDQMGTNLNRVYLDPCFKFHPSIYAVKSLIVYHHINNRISKEHDGLNFDHIFKLEYDDEPVTVQVTHTHIESELDFASYSGNKPKLPADSDTGISYTSATSSSFSPVIDTVKMNSDDANQKKSYVMNSGPKSSSSENSPEHTDSCSQAKKFNSNNNLIVDNEKRKFGISPHMIKAESINESFSRNKALAERLSNEWAVDSDYFINKNCKNKKENNSATAASTATTSSTATATPISERMNLDDVLNENGFINEKNEISVDDDAYSSRKKESGRIGNENSDDDDDINYALFSGAKNSPHLNDQKLALINPLWSGVAFYVDLHGHAAKRGCFIYGNSLENELYQVENVLFAKLISISSQHFDFDGCNFSVRNMYMKDKREGLSKEGSGRVAMYKTLGLIHSYTLECCYASGRVMNTIVPAINSSAARSSAISPPLHSDLPPKFTPEHYADVGKAVAIAALDIIEMNPHTRIPNTSFGSLEAIRNWLKFYIRSKSDRGGNTFSNSVNSNNFSNIIPMPIGSSQPNSNSLKKTNQRFYFQQKLNKIIVNPTKSSTNTVSTSASISDNNAAAKNQEAQPQAISSKSTTNLNAQVKLNSNLKLVRDSVLKKTVFNAQEDSAATTSSKAKVLTHSSSQGNLAVDNLKNSKTPDTSGHTSIKTSSIGLVDFSNSLISTPAQLGIAQFRFFMPLIPRISSTRNKVRHTMRAIKDLEGPGNNSKSISNASINSPTNISSGSSSSNNQQANIQKTSAETFTSQLRRKLSIKTETYQKKVSENESTLETEFNGTLGKLTSRDKRWFLVKDSEPTNLKDDNTSQLNTSNILASNNYDEFTYQTPEEISAKLANSSNLKHLTPLNKSMSKLMSSSNLGLLNNNDITGNVLFFKQLNSNLMLKTNSSKVIPMSLANNTNIVSSLRSETSFKNFESTSAPLKKNTNRMKPKSGRSTIMENPIEINFKNALIETKNLYDFSDVVRNINYETATEKKSSMKKSNLNKDASNNQVLETTDNTLNMNRKQIKYLKTQEISSNVLTKIKKKK